MPAGASACQHAPWSGHEFLPHLRQRFSCKAPTPAIHTTPTAQRRSRLTIVSLPPPTIVVAMSSYTRSVVIFLLLSLLHLALANPASVRSNAGGLSTSTPEDRVSLLALPSLTFTATSFTTARRGTPHAQLECIGGTAATDIERHPVRVDCYNVGLDDTAPAGQPRPKWHCVSALHRGVRIENWQVHCEGWSYPDDEFIIAGSCWLAYELEYEEAVPLPAKGEDGASAAVEDRRRSLGIGNFFRQLRNLLLALGAVYLFVRFGWPMIAARRRASTAAPDAVPLVKAEHPGYASGEAADAGPVVER